MTYYKIGFLWGDTRKPEISTLFQTTAQPSSSQDSSTFLYTTENVDTTPTLYFPTSGSPVSASTEGNNYDTTHNPDVSTQDSMGTSNTEEDRIISTTVDVSYKVTDAITESVTAAITDISSVRGWTETPEVKKTTDIAQSTELDITISTDNTSIVDETEIYSTAVNVQTEDNTNIFDTSTRTNSQTTQADEDASSSTQHTIGSASTTSAFVTTLSPDISLSIARITNITSEEVCITYYLLPMCICSRRVFL